MSTLTVTQPDQLSIRTSFWSAQTWTSMLPSQKDNAPTGPQVATSSPTPRLNYFISRSNGNIVPLIPADELPYKVRLFGVQRVMRMEETHGMNHVGTHPITGQSFKLESDILHTSADATISERRNVVAPKQLFVESDRSPSTPNRGQVPSRQQPASATAVSWRSANDTPSPKPLITAGDTVTPNSPSLIHTPQTTLKTTRTFTSSPSSSSSEPGDKVYCTHWIRHGECDYMQQGCRYKHEMPDKETLASIGFRVEPRWWQEKKAVRLGQSARPTVGPAMKPSEWLNKRKSSTGSLSGDDSVRGCDFESEPQSGSVEDPVLTAGNRRRILKPRTTRGPNAASEEGGSLAVIQPAKTSWSFNNIDTPTSAPPKTKGAEDPAPPLSPGSDLINLDPVSPTIASPCATHTTTDRDDALQLRFLTSRVPSLAEPSSKQPTKPTRKVFVPAGESMDFHIADARKHAKFQEKPDRKNQRRKSTDKPKGQTKKDTARRSSIAPEPLVVRKRADVKTGLLASKHAPQPDTANVSKHADVKTGLPASKHAPPQPDTANVPKRANGQSGLLASKHASGPDTAKEAESSRAADTSSTAKSKPPPSRPKSKGRNKSPEATRQGQKQASKSACRPRRATPKRSQAYGSGYPPRGDVYIQKAPPVPEEID